jgi:protein phosphatase
MLTSSEDVKQLIKESLKAEFEDFLDLTDHISSMLSSETDHLEGMEITGRLVQMRPEFEAIVVGDLHGDLETLALILETSEFLQEAKRGQRSMLFFLGDYGDRGILSPEVYYVVLKLKASFPNHVVLMRGNHEGPDDLSVSPHDLPTYLRTKFGVRWSEVYAGLKRLHGLLYTSVVVEGSCVLLHGGVPSHAKSLSDLAYAHIRHPQESHLEEILWSDPEEGMSGTRPSPRGAGKLFGQDVTQKFLRMLKVNVLIRGHEPAELGYKINHAGRLLTLFSRKGDPYFNTRGAFLQFDMTKRIRDAFQLESSVRQV